MKNIYLIGMPGVGKSYWALQLAAHLGLQSVDLDDIIEVRSGMTIAQFWAQHGEVAFRQLEQDTLQQVMQVFAQDTIVACGGGTPCHSHNMEQMKASGTVLYLQASLKYLVQNLEAEIAARPLLQQPNWQEQLAEMYAHRKEYYSQAHHTLMAASLRLQDFDALL